MGYIMYQCSALDFYCSFNFIAYLPIESKDAVP